MASSIKRSLQITSALSLFTVVGDVVKNLGNPTGLFVICEMTGGTGGSTITALVQSTLDGEKWFDVGCFTFTTTPLARTLNLRNDVGITTPATLGTDAMSSDGGINGPIGDSIRFKVKSTGTYSNTSINFSYVVTY